MIKIISNKVRCKKCNTIIESKYRHDFVGCKCWNKSNGKEGVAVDGGQDYLKRSGDVDNCEDLSEVLFQKPSWSKLWEDVKRWRMKNEKS